MIFVWTGLLKEVLFYSNSVECKKGIMFNLFELYVFINAIAMILLNIFD